MRFHEDGAVEKSSDVTNLLVDEFIIAMETSGQDASWLNINNERHNRSMNNMVREGLVDINQHENKCYQII